MRHSIRHSMIVVAASAGADAAMDCYPDGVAKAC